LSSYTINTEDNTVVHEVFSGEKDPNKITFLHYLLENYSIYDIEDMLRFAKKHHEVGLYFNTCLRTAETWDRLITEMTKVFMGKTFNKLGNYLESELVKPIII